MTAIIAGFLIGGFESQPKAWSVDGVDWNFSQQLLPPEWELFQELLDGALRRVPEIENAQSVKLINGPDAMTPDGQYALGTPELGLSNWEAGRLLARSGVLSGDTIHTVRMRVRQHDPDLHR